MTNNSADHHPGNSVAEGSHEGDFGCSVMELRSLMDLRSAEAINRINETFGGVHNICKRLKTSPVEGKGIYCLGGEICFLGLWRMGVIAVAIHITNESSFIHLGCNPMIQLD